MPDRPAIGKLTAQQVIDMFAGLGLPVCDDGDLIRQKFEEKRPLYLRWLRSPQPQVHKDGEEGVQNGEMMMNKRPELLDVVYTHFRGLASSAISAAISGGEVSLSDNLLQNLRSNQAIQSCRTDEKLADVYLARFCKEEGLKPADALVIPALVKDFRAESQVGQVVLRWNLPAEKCDLVEIIREEESPSGKSRKVKKDTIYRGRDEGFTDTDVRSGQWYLYHIHAVYLKVDGVDDTRRAVCLGDVRSAAAAWRDGSLRLTWDLPGKDTSVFIYRREGSPPEITRGAAGFEAGDPSTRMVYHGAGFAWDDVDAAEGCTYFYTLITQFGEDLFSEGVTIQASLPRTPLPASELVAAYGKDEKGHAVILQWQPCEGENAVDYVIVRREGNAPPAKIGDGKMIQQVGETRFVDQQVQPGSRYTYAVFSRAGDLYSRIGAASQPIVVMAEVDGLAADAGDGTVELVWQTPPNVEDVIVRRGAQPPRDHLDGEQIRLSGPGHAHDSGLINGQSVHYLVCCVYRPGGSDAVISPGHRVIAIPERLPEAAADFCALPEALQIACSWTAPTYGQPVVLRSGRPHALAYGQRLHAAEVDRLGERITIETNNRAVDKQPDAEKPYYSLFTLAGDHAVAGGSAAAVLCTDISNLKVGATRDGVTLRWSWPAGVKAAWIVRRHDHPPQRVDDPQAVATPCSLIEYRNGGEKFVDKMVAQHGRFYYSVFSQVPSSAGQFFSPGIRLDCHAEIQWEPWMTLDYRLSSPANGPHQGKDIQIHWTVEKPFENFAGFVLVASQTMVPETLDDGVELFRWTPEQPVKEGSFDAWVSLEPVQRKRWSRFYCKAIPADMAQRHATLIIHPNTCHSYSPEGKVEESINMRAVQGYEAGVPDKVICPYCFDEFPIEQMLFDSYMGGEAIPAKYSYLDKMLKRPLPVVKNKQGQILSRKLCPKERHVLPFTAGSQSSLIIGLIGAKFSGKSHYIASLINQLENQVGADMQAALLPVTDETQERYRREFYNPLFKNSVELALTIGTPPPLIYDLTLDGRQWNEKQHRAVTLALYDTAGENLQDPATARQMVQYLRVASGVIFLVDPLQVPAVREMLPSSIQPPPLDADAAPYQIIANVLQILERGEVVHSNTPVSIPVAVVMTKCDVLADAGLIESNRLWGTDKRHIGYFDTHAHQDMSGMIEEYFQRWNREAYNNIHLRFARHAFFGVSATGCASDPLTRRYKYISPWRVEDPLLWLLAELNVIQKG